MSTNEFWKSTIHLKAARQVNDGRIPRMGQGPGKLDLFLM
jgi:hypothetical protein